MSKATDETFSPEETKKRFEAALRGARIAGSKPMSGDAKKPVRQKRQRKATSKRG